MSIHYLCDVCLESNPYRQYLVVDGKHICLTCVSKIIEYLEINFSDLIKTEIIKFQRSQDNTKIKNEYLSKIEAILIDYKSKFYLVDFGGEEYRKLKEKPEVKG